MYSLCEKLLLICTLFFFLNNYLYFVQCVSTFWSAASYADVGRQSLGGKEQLGNVGRPQQPGGHDQNLR